MDFQSFAEKLKDQLALPLPGEDIQLSMAPETRLRYQEYISSIPDAQQSGVLICIYPRDNSPYTILMLRPGRQGVHSGQVSFPGGRFDDSDKDLEHTALREAEEEIGINSSEVTIIGKLTPLIIPVSKFHVQPFIGILNRSPTLKLNKAEVISIIELELYQLLHEKLKMKDEFHSGNGRIIKAPYYEIAGQKVWGATAMILRELEEIMKAIRREV